MSDDDDTSISTEESIAERHKREKKELRVKTLAMKKAAKSGNKQKQKETNAQIEKMEKDMEDRHKKELSESEKPDENLPAQQEEPENSGFYKEIKLSSKAAKRQLKNKEKEEKWKEAMKADREAEKSSLRHYENEIITKMLNEKGFAMHEIDPDGDCMYNSIAHQLDLNGVEMTGTKLRKICAEYMNENKDDFLPFIAEDDGEVNWEKYIKGVENMAENGGVWGGELELNAISRALRRPIEVFNTDSLIKYGDEFVVDEKKPIRIVYLRNAYQLGEHYNSTVQK